MQMRACVLQSSHIHKLYACPAASENSANQKCALVRIPYYCNRLTVNEITLLDLIYFGVAN
jgi:hypothetical protein